MFRAAARLVGIIWMVAGGLIWLWLGYAEPFGRIDGSEPHNWTLLTLISDSQFGLTMVPILMGGIGYAIYSWGRSR